MALSRNTRPTQPSHLQVGVPAYVPEGPRMVTNLHRGAAICVAAVITLTIAGCAAGPSASISSSPAPAASPQPSPAPPTSTPAPTLAPLTTTSNQVVASVELGSDISAPVLGVVLYGDGSLLDLRTQPFGVWRLSEAGLETYRSRLHDSGLFTTSRSLPAKPVDMGFMTFAVTFVDGGVSVRVGATNAGDTAESRALVALADALLNPVDSLPGGAFVDGDTQLHPYRALQAMVTSESVSLPSDAWINPTQALDRVVWPLATPPAALGEPVAVAGHPERQLRCGLVDGATEGLIRSALASLTSNQVGPEYRTSSWYLWLNGPALLRLTLHTLLPHETAGCSPANLPGPPTLAQAPRPTLAALLEASQNGVTPAQSAPDLFVQIIRVSDDATLAHVSYYADGTVLFRDPEPPAVGIGARRLTAAGLAQLQQALDASGLLGSSYNERVPDGATWGVTCSIVTGKVILNATDRGIDARASAIVTLAKHLADPVGWLPADAWVGGPTIRAFRPASIVLSIQSQDAAGGSPLPSIGRLRWPLPGGFSATSESTTQVSAPEAIAVMQALSDAGGPSWGSVTNAEYRLLSAEGNMEVIFTLSVASGEWGP